MTEEIANRAYDVLVQECEALEGEREGFVRYMTAPGMSHKEWRFRGSLGVGGKLYWNHGRVYASCYIEDQTPERTRRINRTNEILAAVVTPYLSSPSAGRKNNKL
jgi:hypothetical protein